MNNDVKPTDGDFTVEAWCSSAGWPPPLTSVPPSLDTISATTVFRVDGTGWTHVEIKRAPEPVTYIHGEVEIIDGIEFNVVSCYDSKTMKLRQKVVTRSDLLKG